MEIHTCDKSFSATGNSTNNNNYDVIENLSFNNTKSIFFNIMEFDDLSVGQWSAMHLPPCMSRLYHRSRRIVHLK